MKSDKQPETKSSREAVNKAMKLLQYRPRSEMELREKLTAAGFTGAETADAIEYVSSFGYLNDQRFAENYVISYRGKKSRMVMKRELRAKGVDEIFIEEALELAPGDEKEIMMELLIRKYGVPHRLDEKEYRRSSGFLARRGYAAGDIARVIRRYQDMADEEM